MNWDQIAGSWKQCVGKARETWAEFTEDELERIGGKKDQLIGLIQEKYGVAKEEAERQVAEFRQRLE